MDSLSAANGTFAINLFKKLTESNNKCNLFFSPLSISSALGMIYLGAKGNTASQMSKVLQFEKAKDVHAAFQSLISEINKPGTDYLLRTANRLYGEKSFTFLDAFLGSTQKHYHADLQSVDFATKADDSRKEINSWVEQKTEGKIQDLLPSDSVDTLTKLVLVNAIYFKGNWANQFDKKYTHEVPFRLNKNETKPVQMMYKKAKYPMTYAGELFTKVLELPYVNNELSMIIMLPDDIEDGTTGLEKLEKGLTYSKFLEWTDPQRMDITEMELHLPKFKLEDNYDLKSVLSGMGMPDAFDQGKSDFSGMSSNNELVLSKLEQQLTYEKFADLTNPDNMDRTEVELSLPKFKLEDCYDLDSVLGGLGMTDVFDVEKCDLAGMSGDRDLVLSKVVHKSFVEVNEEGTEAAAATGAVIMLRCARTVPRFTCDHPFLFFIIHKQSRCILFFGRFTSP